MCIATSEGLFLYLTYVDTVNVCHMNKGLASQPTCG